MKYRMRGLTRRQLAAATFASCLATRAHAQAGRGLIALGGFDAVSYFLDREGQPLPGRPENEWQWNGRAWRFARAANLVAFRDAPAIYAPRLGGFDPIGVAEGRIVDTDPLVYAILPHREGEGLYLLRNVEHRSRVLAEPGIVAAAEERWPSLRPLMENGASP